MRRKADEASLPPTGDQLPVDPRPEQKPFHSLRGPDLFWSTIFHLKDVMMVSPQFDLKYPQMAS